MIGRIVRAENVIFIFFLLVKHLIEVEIETGVLSVFLGVIEKVELGLFFGSVELDNLVALDRLVQLLREHRCQIIFFFLSRTFIRQCLIVKNGEEINILISVLDLSVKLFMRLLFYNIN